MNIYKILVLIFFSIYSLNAQVRHDYNWLFGYAGGENHPDYGLTQINFNNSPVAIEKTQGDLWIYTSNATMSDADGNLIFYFNGCQVMDATHQLMMNGDSLNLGITRDEQCDIGYPGGDQNCLVIPSPISNNQYYVFYERSHLNLDPVDIIHDILYYAIIDMTFNDGRGAVIEKNEILLENDDLGSGELTASRHSNGVDWWLITPRNRSSEYVRFLITADGISEPFTQNIGNYMQERGSGSGQVCFSPDGTKYARYNKFDGIFLFDFNREDGALSNFRKVEYNDTLRTGGIAFSPNSRYLYASSTIELFQIDTEAENLGESMLLIGEYDGFRSPFATTFFQQQLGPDCRIYMNASNGVDKLHVINYPDRRGAACDFQQHSIDLPTFNQISLPHFPNYRLGIEPTYPCDSTIVLPMMTTTIEYVEMDEEILKYYPNPVRDVLNVEISNVVKEGTIRLINALGEVVLEKTIEKEFSTTLDVAHLPAGVYYISISELENLITSNKVIITK